MCIFLLLNSTDVGPQLPPRASFIARRILDQTEEILQLLELISDPLGLRLRKFYPDSSKLSLLHFSTQLNCATN